MHLGFRRHTGIVPLIAIGLIGSLLNLKATQALTCNGSPKLCDKRYNQVTYPTAHNSQSYLSTLSPKALSILQPWIKKFAKLPSINVNDQDMNITEQLKGGIRAAKMKVMSVEGATYVCHGMNFEVKEEIKRRTCNKLFFSFLKSMCSDEIDTVDPCVVDPAAVPLTEALHTISLFLDEHPGEVVTLFLEDYTDSFENLRNSFDTSEISKYAYHQDIDKEWPTLGEMIDSNKRVVVFVNRDIDNHNRDLSNYSIFNSWQTFVWGSNYHFETIESLMNDDPQSCNLEKVAFRDRNKSPRNKLWILQHFITPGIAGDPNDARQANKASVLEKRITRYRNLLGANPNFIWVDFFELPKGEPGFLDVINRLNQTL